MIMLAIATTITTVKTITPVTTQDLYKITPSRDPFFLPTKISHASPLKNLKLIGTIASNNKLGAIIENKKKQKIIFIGDTINNYTVQKISKNKLSLIHKNSHEHISLNLGGRYHTLRQTQSERSC